MAITFEASTAGRVRSGGGLRLRRALPALCPLCGGADGRLHPGRDFDICLCALGETLAVPDSLAPLGLRYCRIETGGALGGCGSTRGGPRRRICGWRCRRRLRAEYRRILYLDCGRVPAGWGLADIDGGRPRRPGDRGGARQLAVANAAAATAAVPSSGAWTGGVLQQRGLADRRRRLQRSGGAGALPGARSGAGATDWSGSTRSC